MRPIAAAKPRAQAHNGGGSPHEHWIIAGPQRRVSGEEGWNTEKCQKERNGHRMGPIQQIYSRRHPFHNLASPTIRDKPSPLAGPPRKQRFSSPKRGAHLSVRTLIRRSIEGFSTCQGWGGVCLAGLRTWTSYSLPGRVYLIICGCPRLNH